MNEEKINDLKDSVPDDKLEQASGAAFRTLMVCQKCGFMNFWNGYYVGQYLDCPNCGGKNTYYGQC